MVAIVKKFVVMVITILVCFHVKERCCFVDLVFSLNKKSKAERL